MIDSETEVYGVIGYPIKHSLSPKLHSFLFKSYLVNAIYTAFEVQNIKKAIEGIRALGIKGVNITVPYKENVVSFIDKVDAEAEAIKAVNTIKNQNGRLIGFNTDYIGFIDMFQKNIQNNPEIVTVLGAGGAAKAIVYALYKLGFKSVFMLNRTRTNAEKIKNQFSNFIDINIADLNNKNIISASDVIINCTSVGLKNDSTPININYVDKAVIMDIIYKDSPLIKKAKQKNLNAVNGMDMFISQALHAFKIFTGIEADEKLACSFIKGDVK